MSESTREAMPPLSAQIIGAVLRASQRSAVAVHEEMREGLSGLATIAYLAPWFGVLATVLAIPDAFVGCGGEKSACMAAMTIRLSRSIWPTAFGLLIGLTSAWGNRYLTGMLEGLDRAMEGRYIDLVNQLARYRGLWKLGPKTQPVGGHTIFGAESLAESTHGQRFWQQSLFLTGAALVVAWCLEMIRYLEFDSRPLDSATWAACKYVLFVLGASYLPAHFVWVRVMRRIRGGLALLASTVCLCWCFVELVFGIHLL